MTFAPQSRLIFPFDKRSRSESRVWVHCCLCQCSSPSRQSKLIEDSNQDVRFLDAASDPGVPYPKWMVLQLDTAEDPRPKVLHPERYADGGIWKDLRKGPVTG